MVLSRITAYHIHILERKKHRLAPIRASTALVDATSDPSIASSRNKSIGSQSEELLTP